MKLVPTWLQNLIPALPEALRSPGWPTTATLLILVFLALRFFVRDKISMRARYALWLVVLFRLLIPFQLPVTLPAAPVQLEDSVLYQINHPTVMVYPHEYAEDTAFASIDYGFGSDREALWTQYTASGLATASTVQIWTRYEMMLPIFMGGSLILGFILLLSNLWFYHRLRASRIRVTSDDSPLPVYTTDSLVSPCLFGLFRPAVYLTPSISGDTATLRHVLAHELTHYTHRDHIWSFLRCVCLALHWYNPMVWAAAILSKRDGELACDEGAVARLGEAERFSYGRTLIDMVAQQNGLSSSLFSCSTSMNENSSALHQRITALIQHPKSRKAVLFTAIILISIAAVFVFAQGGSPGNNAKPPSQPSASVQEAVPLTKAELDFFNYGDFFDHGDRTDYSAGVNIRNQFLSSFYDDPRDIDLSQLFYCGTGQAERSIEETQAIMADIIASVPYYPDCGCTIVTTAEMDAVLTEHMGLTLAQTNKVGLEGMSYLPKRDLYFHFHGDTNYGQMIHFTSGQRSGNTIWLYYQDTFGLLGRVPCVLTLYQDGERYYFRANQPAAVPDTKAPEPPPDDISGLIRSAVSFHFAQGPFSSYIGPTVTDPVLVDRAIQILLSADPYSGTVQHGTPEDGSILTLYGDFGDSVNELALPISNQTMCEELLVLAKLQDQRLQLAQALSSDTYRKAVPLLSEQILSDPHWAEMLTQFWNYDHAQWNRWLEEKLAQLGFDPYFNQEENIWFFGQKNTPERISLSGAYLSYETILNYTASPVGLSVPSAANEDKTILTFGDSLAHHYLNLDPRHPKAVTSARLTDFEITGRSDTVLCVSISLAIDPAAPHTVFWMSGAGIDQFEDGPYAGEWKFTLEYRLELQSDGFWMCTETATGGLHAD